MKTRNIMLSLLITAIVALSYNANAQDTNNLHNYNKMQIDTSHHGKKKMMIPDSGYNKKQMNQNQHQKNHNDTMVLQKNNMQPKENPDYIMMQNGKLVQMQNGKTMPLNQDMTLTNGTVVMRNGKYKMKNGTVMTLKEGEMMDLNGKIKTSKNPPSK